MDDFKVFESTELYLQPVFNMDIFVSCTLFAVKVLLDCILLEIFGVLVANLFGYNFLFMFICFYVN